MPLDSRLLNKPKLAEIKTLIPYVYMCVWVIIEPKGQSSDLCHQISLLPLLLIFLCTTKNEYPEIKDACHYKKPLADYFFPYYISTTYQAPIAVRQNNFSKEVKRENNWEKCEVMENFQSCQKHFDRGSLNTKPAALQWAGLDVGKSTENYQKVLACQKKQVCTYSTTKQINLFKYYLGSR